MQNYNNQYLFNNINPHTLYKPIPSINEWEFCFELENKSDLNSLRCYIKGYIKNSDKFANDTPITTGSIKNIEFNTSLVTTSNNTIYRLANMNKSFKKYYNDALQVLINKKIVK